VTIKRLNGSDLIIGEIQAGFIVDLYFDGTFFLVKNLNDASSLENIEQEQLYTNTFVAGNQYGLESITGDNPLSYYDGLVVKFRAIATNDNAVTLNVNSLGAISLVDSQFYILKPGDVGADDLIVAVYNLAENVFQVVKKTENLRLTNSGLVEARAINTPDYLSLANSTAYQAIFVSPYNVVSDDDKKLIFVGNTGSFTLSLPDATSMRENFSAVFAITSVAENRTITLIAPTSIIYSGLGTIPVNTPVSITVGQANTTYLTIYVEKGNNTWHYDVVEKATETKAGVTQLATQAEVDAGADTTKIVTPATLKNVPFIQNLEVVYPVGSLFINISTLMKTDPDQIVPGWGTFTWERIDAGEPNPNPNYCLLVGSDVFTKPGTVSLGADPIIGYVENVALDVAHIPPHTHPQPVNFFNSTYYTDYSSIPQISPVPAGVGSPQGGNARYLSGSVGGGAPHSHQLGLSSYIAFAYVRTA
jgi:hypothetical protein